MRVHTNERPFGCNHCDKRFKTKGHLRSHIMTHTGEKPYVCTFSGCHAKFSRPALLKIHARSHTGERPFKCTEPGCSRTFSDKSNLRAHEKTHKSKKHLPKSSLRKTLHTSDEFPIMNSKPITTTLAPCGQTQLYYS